MEVIAHIETAPAETTQPATESGSTVPPDNGSVSTGETVSACVVISLLLLIISAFVIYICNKNGKTKSIPGNK
ncbi:MAG: hypothetical protein ACI4HZ_10970 [Ruminococcus sp.]